MLTSVVRRRDAESRQSGHEELERRLAEASSELAERLVRHALREAESALLAEVSERLRAELPALIAAILREHLHETK